ncbi:hypothetical protein PHET_08200, partial [Paragonimus heterotremus]
FLTGYLAQTIAVFFQPLAALGADVLGIDQVAESIDVAHQHVKQVAYRWSGPDSKPPCYRLVSLESLVSESPGQFDAVVMSEVLEHVTDWEGMIHQASLFLKVDWIHDNCLECVIIRSPAAGPGPTVWPSTMRSALSKVTASSQSVLVKLETGSFRGDLPGISYNEFLYNCLVYSLRDWFRCRLLWLNGLHFHYPHLHSSG